MNKYSVGQKVRCISDDNNEIKPGTILTINNYSEDFDLYEFEEKAYDSLYSYEIEPLNRTIRDVVIGDVFEDLGFNIRKVVDVGKHGLVDEFETYFSWSEAEDYNFTIKQPEQEKQEIEIAHYGDVKFNRRTVFNNRELIIELQKQINKIRKDLNVK